jgi:predicted  nucleic acid-binding Zn-ribbon protein
MEARFNEKVREFQARIEETKDPGTKSALEAEMYEYMILSAPFIREYHHHHEETTSTKKVAGVQIQSRKGVQRKDIFKSYLENVEGQDIPPARRRDEAHSTPCTACGAVFSKVLDEVSSEEICKECGVSEFFLGDEVGFKEEQEMEKNIVYSYKRENHFNEWVSQFQAKESTSVPREVIEQLRAEFKKQRVRDLSEITHEKVKSLLKKLGHSRFYEHVPYITTILNGIQPPTMNQALEERLRLMFYQIQEPFEKHRPLDRKNFLSYSFVLYKMCELLGEDDYLPCFPLLKSKEKLYKQDEIWKGICKELKWAFYKTI